MKTAILITSLTSIIILITGCSADRYYTVSLTGDRIIVQPTYKVEASVVRIVHYGNTFSFPEDLNGANAFMFYFTGITNEVKIGIAGGTYHYKNKPEKPLELSYSTSNRVVFIPKPDEIESEHLKSGLYRLTIKYAMDAQECTNNFQIDYTLKYKTKWVFWWDLIGIDPI